MKAHNSVVVDSSNQRDVRESRNLAKTQACRVELILELISNAPDKVYLSEAVIPILYC